MGREQLPFPPTLLFLLINQAVDSITVGQSGARPYVVLRLLYLEPRAERGRLKNKEGAIMDWSLFLIGTFTAFWGVLALYLIW